MQRTDVVLALDLHMVRPRNGRDRNEYDGSFLGDEVNEGNLVIDAHMKGDSGKAHRFLSGMLRSLDYEKSQMTLSTSGGEKNFKIKPETRMFKEITAGAQVTVELNEMGEVIDLHKDKK